jgi:putative transposase
MTAIWCGEDGWGYLTAVLDCFDPSMLGWSMTPRCRARDFSPAMEMAWSTAWPYGPETPPTVVLRHDNGTQFTSEYYREVAHRLGIKLSRTRYRHPDGNALVERIFLSLKQEEVWPQDYASFAEAQAAVMHWILDYNTERPHQSLKYRTRRFGRRHWDQRNPQPELSTAGGVTTEARLRRPHFALTLTSRLARHILPKRAVDYWFVPYQ